jgi:hypothetical protein
MRNPTHFVVVKIEPYTHRPARRRGIGLLVARIYCSWLRPNCLLGCQRTEDPKAVTCPECQRRLKAEGKL